jgi:hypothetical protein
MRNRVSSNKQYCQEQHVSSRWRPLAFAAAIGVLASALPGAAAGQDFQPPGAPAPSLARIFTPRQAPHGAYLVSTVTDGIEGALRTVKAALSPGSPEGEPAGSWQVQQLDPLEAFGTTAIYDRSKVAQLYAGRRVSVVRGPIERSGRVVGATTLISPYPDSSLSRLETGTMVIVLRLTGGGWRTVDSRQ